MATACDYERVGPPFGAGGVALVFAGEVVEVQFALEELVSTAWVAQDITGRAFALRVVGRAGATPVNEAGVNDVGAGVIAFTISAADTALLVGSATTTAYIWELCEVTDAGRQVIMTGDMTVVLLADPDAVLPDPEAGAAVEAITRYTIRSGQPVISVRYLGQKGPDGPDGPAGPAAWSTVTAWLTATAYTATAPASVVTTGGSSYVCIVSHTSGTFATDLAAGKWLLLASKGDPGDTGTGVAGGGADGQVLRWNDAAVQDTEWVKGSELVWRNIATGATIPTSIQGTADDKKMSCRVHYLTQACSRVRLVYVNGYSYQTDGGNSSSGMGLLTVTATVAYPGKDNVIGTVTATIAKGEVKSLDVALSTTVPAGAKVFIGTFATPEAGTRVPQFNCSEGSPVVNSRVNTTLGEASETSASATNKTAAMSTIVNDGLSPYGPSAILAEVLPTVPCVMIDGDSQNAGAWAGPDAYNNRGWFSHAIGDDFGTVNLSSSSRRAMTAKGSCWLDHALAVAAGATHVVVTLGIGDIAASQTATELQNSLRTMWAGWAGIGVKPLAATVLPDTTSTDSWVTVGNQTAHANSAAIVTVNTYIRTSPAPLTGYIESAWAVESAHDSQKWAAPLYTSDGLHPGIPGTDITTARNALIAAVSLSAFVVPVASGDLPFTHNPYGLDAVSISGAINALAVLTVPMLLLQSGGARLLEGGGQFLLET